MYYLFNTSKYEKMMNNNRNQELIMIFGISFSMCFFMKSVSSSSIGSTNTPIQSQPSVPFVSQSTRPPF